MITETFIIFELDYLFGKIKENDNNILQKAIAHLFINN